VGNFDLHEGMQQAASQYSTRVLASFQKVLDLHIVLFVLSWTATFAFVVFIFKPFLRRVQAESRRVAELLSQLPADMDVEALVEQALGRRKGQCPRFETHFCAESCCGGQCRLWLAVKTLMSGRFCRLQVLVPKY
jgi:hypothetical protein